MKHAAIATMITVVLLFLGIITFIGFYTGYNNDSVGIRDFIGDSIMFLSVLISTVIVLQVFMIWVFVNQTEKLRKFLDNKSNDINSLTRNVKDVNDNLELLL